MRTTLSAFLLIGICLSLQATSFAGHVVLVVRHEFGEIVASTGTEQSLSDGRSVQISRLDYLLSEIALRPAGSLEWLESHAISEYLSLGEGRNRVELGFLPAGKFEAIRFRIGLDSETNASDPNSYPPAHPLNPLVNDLHWGWAGGYIFMALEGRTADDSAFSYHLANDGNSELITLPVRFDTSRDRTLHLDFDIAALFLHIDPQRDSSSTHSRAGDPLPAKLRAGLQQALRVSHVSNQRLQNLATQSDADAPYGTPYPLEITSRLPQVAFTAGSRPTVQGVALGKQLFFDKRLSKDSSQSCASCHHPDAAFSDPGKRLSIGVEGIAGKRNSPPLFNLAWQDGFFWDGRAKTLREQVLIPVTDEHEMNADISDVVDELRADQEMVSGFEAAFGTSEVDADRIARALEQYLLTLVAQDSKFDRAVRGDAEFTEEEKRGLELFITEHDPARGLRGADCFHCHGGNLFTSRRYSNNGLEAEAMDLGRFNATDDPADIGKFKVPSLRNIAVTAPYMHDGRFGSLEEVIDHYDHGVQRSATLDPNLAKHPPAGLGLSAADKRALVAFLNTLTEQEFIK